MNYRDKNFGNTYHSPRASDTTEKSATNSQNPNYPESQIDMTDSHSSKVAISPHSETTSDKMKPKKQWTLSFGSTEMIKRNIDDAKSNKRHVPSNKVRTTRYTILSWAPKSFLWQFKRAANIYFLIITVLTSIDSISPKRKETMIGTFAFVLIFTMLKEGYEDYFRYKSDKELNNRTSDVYNYESKTFFPKKWSDIQIGDFIKIKKDQELPADILMLQSSDLEGGIAFVDTRNLDGETNLKEKMVSKQTKNMTLNNLLSRQGTLLCDAPNPILDKWDGRLSFSQDQPIIVNSKQFLMRGCILKNREFIYALVVYTGHDSKIMKNAKKPPSKISRVLKVMNYLLYSVLGFQLFVIILFASLNIAWKSNTGPDHYYIKPDENVNAADFVLQMLTYWVAYSHLIPISLYVCLEMLKLGLAYFINHDEQMRDYKLDRYANCRTSDLIEELGQVEFIFSDKTGTLTCNKMDFMQFSVLNCIYGVPLKDLTVPDTFPIRTIHEAKNAFKDGLSEEAQAIKKFMNVMTVCQTVMPEKQQNGKIKFQASSPDEKALVKGAQKYGFRFHTRTNDTIEIKNIKGENETYIIMEELQFDNDRKRMSIVAKKMNDDNIILYCKGADSSILERVNVSVKERTTIENILYQFSTQGLRTLCMAQKILPKDLYEDWKTRRNALLSEAGGVERDRKERALFDEMENNMEYLGASAIEDKLQEGVPQTIKTLMDADIRVWVLTGDKQETAIEIGHSCHLIRSESEMELVDLSSNSEMEFENKMQTCKTKFGISFENKIQRIPFREYTAFLERKVSIVINGKTLAYAIANDKLKNNFFRLGLLANSVICCRVSPKQKSDVVAMAKKFGNWVTLAIGDGANDVSMIMEAHIGVGIHGKEGTQAVMSSDYSISQFQFLLRLLMVHGRWGYRKVSWFICYYFYKNILLVLTELWFVNQNGYSGQIFFADWLPMLYNAFWTSWPCLFAFAFEQDINSEKSLQNPILYKAGQIRYYFNLKRFWIWIILALWHGIVCYYLPLYGLQGINDGTGKTKDHWWQSSVSFTLILHIVTYKLFVETSYWNNISTVVSFLSIVFYYLITFIGTIFSVSSYFQPELAYTFVSMFACVKFILILLGVPMIALIPDISINLIQRIYCSTPADKIMYEQKFKEPVREVINVNSKNENNDSQAERSMVDYLLNQDSNSERMVSNQDSHISKSVFSKYEIMNEPENTDNFPPPSFKEKENENEIAKMPSERSSIIPLKYSKDPNSATKLCQSEKGFPNINPLNIHQKMSSPGFSIPDDEDLNKRVHAFSFQAPDEKEFKKEQKGFSQHEEEKVEEKKSTEENNIEPPDLEKEDSKQTFVNNSIISIDSVAISRPPKESTSKFLKSESQGVSKYVFGSPKEMSPFKNEKKIKEFPSAEGSLTQRKFNEGSLSQKKINEGFLSQRNNNE